MNARKGAAVASRAKVRKTLAVAGLIQAAAGAIGPDAALLEDVERARTAHMAGADLYHAAHAPHLPAGVARERRERAFALGRESQELQQVIAGFRPHTMEGARAKVELALCLLEETQGTFWDLSKAALRDALAWLSRPMGQQ